MYLQGREEHTTIIYIATPLLKEKYVIFPISFKLKVSHEIAFGHRK